MMLITGQHIKGDTCKLGVQEDDRVEYLQHNIYEWYSVPPRE